MKKALSVGINYPGQPHRLRGCVNDSYMIKQLLSDHFGFEDITLLLDNDATTEAILVALHTLVDGAQPGDVLFFHYSGHGSQMPDKTIDDDYEPDGLDEIICPVDLNWRDKVIRDDQLKQIFDTIPAGVNLTVLLDCCNSGGGLDQENQYQSLAPGETRFAGQQHESNRFLQPPGDITEYAETRKLKIKPKTWVRGVDHNCLLLSGCQSNQTSADAYINGKFCGAATYYIIKAIRNFKYSGSYVDVIDKANTDIAANGYTQRPELNGPQLLFERVFLSPLSEQTQVEQTNTQENEQPDVTSIDVTPHSKDDKKTNNWLVIVGIIVAGIIAFIINK